MRKRETTQQPHKMSDIMKEMSECLFRDSDAVHSSEAAHVALFFANVAWNECVDLGGEREQIHNVWQTIEAENPSLWDELKSKDIDAMIDELVEYKKAHFPDDRRRILTCGGTERSTIRVEWLPPAAPGEDAQWEMQLYGLVRTEQPEKAVRLLKKTRGMSQNEARLKVAEIAVELGIV